MRNECVTAALQELEKFGLKGEVVDQSKHIKIVWTYPNGQSRFTVCAATPSDHRAPLNVRGEVRRILRADNIQPPSEPVRLIRKAFELPNPQDHGSVKLVRLEKDVDALIDLLVEQQLRTTALETKLQNLRVTATITFEEPHPQVVGSMLKLATSETGLSRQSTGPSVRIMEILASGVWTSRQEIADKSGSPIKNVSSMLQYLKTRGLVENGLRGMWRKVKQLDAIPAVEEPQAKEA